MYFFYHYIACRWMYKAMEAHKDFSCVGLVNHERSSFQWISNLILILSNFGNSLCNNNIEYTIQLQLSS